MCQILRTIVLPLLFLITTVGGGLAQTADDQSAELVSRCLEAMGGAEAYENTRCLEWTFFGKRHWIWDKWNGDIRLDTDNGAEMAVINANDTTGRAVLNGKEISDPDTLDKYLRRVYEMWINDSYWLVMPFKLKDPGTKLKYIGPEKDLENHDCEVVELSFDNVGVTPENKYHIYFNVETGLICQWDFFRKYSDESPLIQTPWANYEQKGEILLSGDRGGNRRLTDIRVGDSCNQDAFDKLDVSFWVEQQSNQ